MSDKTHEVLGSVATRKISGSTLPEMLNSSHPRYQSNMILFAQIVGVENDPGLRLLSWLAPRDKNLTSFTKATVDSEKGFISNGQLILDRLPAEIGRFIANNNAERNRSLKDITTRDKRLSYIGLAQTVDEDGNPLSPPSPITRQEQVRQAAVCLEILSNLDKKVAEEIAILAGRPAGSKPLANMGLSNGRVEVSGFTWTEINNLKVLNHESAGKAYGIKIEDQASSITGDSKNNIVSVDPLKFLCARIAKQPDQAMAR